MMSITEFRVPGYGSNLQLTYFEPPQPEKTYQMVNESFRIRLFELVYHDCVVSHWYWTDFNAKIIPYWDRFDLFNALYGTPPMFLINYTNWENYKERYVKSYQTAEPVSRLTGYEEMIDHKYITKDRTVQQTTFANNFRVTVNFGSDNYEDIPPMGYRVDDASAGNVPGYAVAMIAAAVALAAVVGWIFGSEKDK
ncbi:Carbohydrate binding domain-containing protein [Histomonas meleagridis]|uniref:Carbohydrate binding domain-containing protein n=1 Tax=Histomonas meleagridis TaxID=135588 RepID=UPI0035597E87|nr:Carbohydrate binding domain-containing protein [Histomonas meleagridis]